MKLHSGLRDIARPLYLRYRSTRADWSQDNACGTPEESHYDSVLLVCIDALRPDFTPDLALSWDHAIAPAPWTFPSVTSLLTGEYPHEHGAVARTQADDESFPVPEQADPDSTLPQAFAEAGYDTLGLFSFINPFLASEGWFRTHRVWGDEPAETLVEYYRDWVRGSDRTFAYMHLGDLHAPVDPPAGYIERHDVDTSLPNLEHILEYTDDYDPEDADCRYYRRHRLRLYTAALEYVEDVLELLLADIGDDTLVVITGDHGEAQYEHTGIDRQFTDSRPNYGVGHGGTPLDTVARVPVGSNGFEPPAETVSLVDLPRTVLSATLAGEVAYEGRSWLGDVESRPVLCEGSRYGAERKAVYFDDRKVIRSEEDGVTLSATLSDGGEQFDADIDAEDLLAALPTERTEGSESEPGRLVEGQLRALGYK